MTAEQVDAFVEQLPKDLDPDVRAGVMDIVPWLKDPLIGDKVEQMLRLAAKAGSWNAFLDGALKTAGGAGSGNHGHAGRLGKVGGSAPDSTPDWQDPGGFEHTGITWKQETDANGRPIPIHADTVEEAAALILQGKVVEVKDVKEAYTLIDKLAQLAQDAKNRGEDAKDYDLCNVSVKGTNIFCASSVRTKEYPNGIPRIEMPQLSGVPTKGSEADALSRDSKGKVDGSDHFIAYLQGIGIRTSSASVPASTLRASQREIIGSKIQGMMANTTFDPGAERIFVSRDSYVVDGHHRWAAQVGRDAADGHLGDKKINIIRVNAPISEVLHLANAWATKFGIPQKAGVVQQAAQTGLRG